MTILSGTVRFSTPDAKRTAGGFSRLVKDNDAVFRRYFGVGLFPGSPTPQVRVEHC